MNHETILSTARRVVETEAQGLTALSRSIDGAFVTAVEKLLGAQGRVIVTGIGKSGHIARKIAATLASTGTPAHFVHPAEASHGDLGMVTPDDVVLAISYSGEAPELSDLVAFTRRFTIPLLAITGRSDSSLGRQADIVLQLPQAPEACSTGVVPTTSTTMTLALGDALAVALMDHRSFTEAHFREFHPGGKLGARLSLVRDVMHDDTPLVPKTTMMTDALLVMTQSGYGVVGAIDDDGTLAGIVTDGDLRRHLDGLLEKCVQDVMTISPKTITADRMAAEAVSVMNDNKITSLIVMGPAGSRTPVGIIRIHDCMRAGVI